MLETYTGSTLGGRPGSHLLGNCGGVVTGAWAWRGVWSMSLALLYSLEYMLGRGLQFLSR